MRRTRRAATGPEVSAVGLGCMGMSDLYGHADRAEAVATIHAALDVTLDAGDLAAVEAAVPPDAAAGDRCASAQMAHLDSERG